jgi:hypothetical protein
MVMNPQTALPTVSRLLGGPLKAQKFLDKEYFTSAGRAGAEPGNGSHILLQLPVSRYA